MVEVNRRFLDRRRQCLLVGQLTCLQDPNKPRLERSLSTFDTPSVLQFGYTYDLPVGRGKMFLGNMPRVLEAVAGTWKTSGIWRISAGRPLVMTLADGTSLPTYGAQTSQYRQDSQAQ